MTQILMEKLEDAFHPIDTDGFTALRATPDRTIVKVTFSVPRNIRQHRLFFALIKCAYDHQRGERIFASEELLRLYITIRAGHYELVKWPNGEVHKRPRSIAFGAMDQAEWKQFFDAAKQVILNEIVPGIGGRDLEQAIADILREPGPDQIER